MTYDQPRQRTLRGASNNYGTANQAMRDINQTTTYNTWVTNMSQPAPSLDEVLTLVAERLRPIIEGQQRQIADLRREVAALKAAAGQLPAGPRPAAVDALSAVRELAR